MNNLKRALSLLVIALLITVLAACGSKSQKDVLSDLEGTMKKMSSYKSEATMTLQTGEQPITYNIEIWHKKPNFYKVSLKNAEKDQSQMILRNSDGVFVLTPALNKSFRFQSEWPENSSQVYLMESLISDILNDDERNFKAGEKGYVFNTKTNYQNKNLYKQEITLDKSNLMPSKVKVMDKDMKILVDVKFKKTKLNSKIDDGAFDMERNMEGAQLEVPTMAAGEKELTPLFPKFIPEGSSLLNQLANDDGDEIILTYAGDKPFTIIQRQAVVAPAMKMLTMHEGNLVDLGFAVGVLSGKTLNWSVDGVDYYLSSSELTQEDMAAIASSMMSTQGK
ncbi:LolA family protein [Pseudalkalibacillus berkeleyi]|uniref:Outer membrane lipoprotein carrier protein LolA n=1 Tax=Pseudalkalibacillus berkeleyi TaxID=1069813 RepID=A0ABS9H6D3_9BACL|nr:outer membrane lipoprotein carrier protein LolA [Pseudalkalibacillus berkeleyi]MCF6139355.1 outer membrane lipoprotein carrier protein LolA [Pseudalkalibacillus berkeleyi]